MLTFAQQHQQRQHHHHHPHASYNFNFEQQQQQQPHPAHSHHPSHSGASHAFFSSSIQSPSDAFPASPLPRHHSMDAGWGVSSSAAAASMFAREAVSAGSYPRHSMPAAMEQQLQRRAEAAAAAARERDFEITTAMQQVDEYCRNYIDFLARELRGEAQPGPKSPTTQRPLQAAAASAHSSRGFDGFTVPAAASGFDAMESMSAPGLAASIAAILASPEFSPAVVPPLLVQPQALLPSGSASAHAASHSHSHAISLANSKPSVKKGTKDNNKKKKSSKKHVVVKMEAPAEAEARSASPPVDDGAHLMDDAEHEDAGMDEEGEGEGGNEGEEAEQEDRSASSSSASDDDDYRPDSADHKKKKSKARAGLGAIFATPLSKSGRPVGRKVKREESAEESEAGSDSEGGGGRNKRKSNKSHAPIAGDIQRKLPLRAVMTLRTFFIGHINHPFPSDGEKRSLAEQCSLNFKQVSDWFTNTRKRFWRPHRDHLDSVGCAADEKAVKGGTKKKVAKGKPRGADVDEDEEMERDADGPTGAAAPPTHVHSWMQMWN